MTVYHSLHEANAARQIEWDADNQITLAYRGNELAGEVGEACNVIKKLERERLGIRGSRDTVEHLAEELADIEICNGLIAMQAGIDLDAAVVEKFNATSEKMGLETRLALRVPAPETKGKVIDFKSDVDLSSASEGVASLWRPQPDALGYAQRLAVSLKEKFPADHAPDWKPLDDILGVLTQIDNITTGLIACSTAMNKSAEPVAYAPFHEERGYLLSLAVQPDQYHAHPSFRPLYAAPPSPDTVREDLSKKLTAHVGRLASVPMNISLAEWNIISNNMLAAAAALSSAPVAPAIVVAGTPQPSPGLVSVADVHPSLVVDVQAHRDAAYKNGWDDGYAEGYGKATLALSRNDRQTEAG
jgi:NTP pyrophosphatase (non-canonical NTP hydrolase)